MDGAPTQELHGSLRTTTAAGKIGPNAVTQLGHAVTEGLGRGAAQAVFARAGVPQLLDHPPAEMTAEAVPAALYAALWQAYPADAPTLAADAGRRTADYVIANRIPRVAQLVLRFAPRRLGARLLLEAIRKNAWTFAGSGQCETTCRGGYLISIKDNPLAMPDCAWHGAVFARLFDRLVAPGTRVTHTACCRHGAPGCRFDIALPKV